MALALNQTTLEKLREENRGDVMLELWKLTLEATPLATTVLPIVAQSEPIEYQGVTYLPFDIQRGSLNQDSDGTIQEVRIDLSNVRRDFVEWLEDPDGPQLLGQEVRMVGVFYSETLLQFTAYEYLWTVGGATVDDSVVSLQLEASGLGEEDIPPDRYQRGGCRWRYRSPECGFEPDPNGDPKFFTCGYRLRDCIERGDDEVARGFPRQHPNHFGAQPGILRRVF